MIDFSIHIDASGQIVTTIDGEHFYGEVEAVESFKRRLGEIAWLTGETKLAIQSDVEMAVNRWSHKHPVFQAAELANGDAYAISDRSLSGLIWVAVGMVFIWGAVVLACWGGW